MVAAAGLPAALAQAPGAPAAAASTAAGSRPAIVDVRSCAPTAADYPVESRRLGETGTTRATFTIDANGKLIAFGVTRSSGSLRLDFTALVKLASCSFKPGTDANGAPAGGTFSVDYIWKLE